MQNEEEQSAQGGEAFVELLRNGSAAQVGAYLADLHPAEIAHLLESIPPEYREGVWALVPRDMEGDVLLEVNDDVRKRLMRSMDHDRLAAAVEGLELDDLADLLQEFPDIVSERILRSMDQQHRERVETIMAYPEDTAGGLMNTDTVTIRADITLDVVLRYLRRVGEVPEATDSLIVVDRHGRYLGVMAITDLLVKDPNLGVADVMDRDVEPITADTPATEVAAMFQRRDLVSAPVVDANDHLLGRITVDDVVDVIREEAEHSLMRMAGLSEENDMFAPVVTSSRRRTIWLGINLLTAFLASWVIGLFEGTIQQLVALAVLMPVVSSMGGIAGTQTLTLVIRGIALGHLTGGNARRLLWREMAVGIVNGLIWAAVVGAVAMAWFDNTWLGAIIAAAILINLVVAALAGATIPFALRKIGVDPALAGGVVLTTVTDVVGFLSFLGLATLFLV